MRKFRRDKKVRVPNKVSNKEFALKDKHFIDACKNAGCDPTARQASKFRNKKGIAYLRLNNLLP